MQKTNLSTNSILLFIVIVLLILVSFLNIQNCDKCERCQRCGAKTGTTYKIHRNGCSM